MMWWTRLSECCLDLSVPVKGLNWNGVIIILFINIHGTPTTECSSGTNLIFLFFDSNPLCPHVCVKRTKQGKGFMCHLDPFGLTLGIIQSSCSNDPYAHAGYKADIPTFEQLNTQ